MFTPTFYVILTALIAGGVFTSANAGLTETKRYSYICLESNQDICMGISPGDSDPVFHPDNIFWLQVKSREKKRISGVGL